MGIQVFFPINSESLHRHLHCESLVQMEAILHSNGVLQKPAWRPTPPQFPTWSPEEKTKAGVELELRTRHSVKIEEQMVYLLCCCRTRRCRLHCQCRTEWVHRAVSSTCQPRGIFVWTCRPPQIQNGQSRTNRIRRKSKYIRLHTCARTGTKLFF